MSNEIALWDGNIARWFNWK